MVKSALVVVLSAALLGASARVRQVPASPLRMTATSLDGFVLCDSLSHVSRAFPSARDTVFVSEQDQTKSPGKIVAAQAGAHVVFRTWQDRRRVWQISTNSPGVRTSSGLHVGSTIGDALGTGQRLRFDYPEGLLVITLVSDGVMFTVDDSSAARFYRRQFDDQEHPLRVLDRAAKIKELIIGRVCPRGRAAT